MPESVRYSGLLEKLEKNVIATDCRQLMCLYGDPAYPLRTHLQAPFRMVQPNANMEPFNKSMGFVWISVEWLFAWGCCFCL